MKKYLIPMLLGITILSTSVAIVALGSTADAGYRPNTSLDDRYTGYRGGMMGGNFNQGGTVNQGGFGTRGGMMGGLGYNTISTDLTGSAYDQTSLKAALDVVLADEYKARAEYALIVDQFGSVNPYVQLIQAETNHIAALSRIYDAFGWTLPADNGAAFAVAPTSLEASYQIGIDAETANIALYETYLNTDLPDSVARVFANLQWASEHHLAAFTAYANGDTSTLTNGFGGCRNFAY